MTQLLHANLRHRRSVPAIAASWGQDANRLGGEGTTRTVHSAWTNVSQRHTVFPAAGPDCEHPAIHLARHGTDLPSRDDEIEHRLGDVLDLVSRPISPFAHPCIMPVAHTSDSRCFR